MKWARGAAIVAGLNLAVPQGVVVAAEAPAIPAATPKIKDVRLTSAGELAGKVVTAQGTGVEGAAITISQNGKPVSKAVSTASGEFKVTGLKTGVYQVSSVQAAQYVRVWQDDVAPPMACTQTTLVQGPCARCQNDGLETDELIIGATAFAALGVGIAALVVANNDDDSSGGGALASP
ncbi:MAG TPA: carboxypeptidase-like regulatory domain-containing protein [Caulifigura sp.]|nr:carboxypeptidase-like regulatory domain-containing protein [Caulifigura sp.]